MTEKRMIAERSGPWAVEKGSAAGKCPPFRTPLLKRVIALAADKVVMEPTLDEALNALFGGQQPRAITRQEQTTQTTGAAVQTTSRQFDTGQARLRLEDAEKAMRQGNWEDFGKAMGSLKRLLADGPAL
jgi:hypothetical protein